MTEHSHPLFRNLATFAVAVSLLASAGAAHAKLTTGQCLAQKRTAWITLRKCQGTEQVKQLKGKPADPTKCQTKFQDALTKISAKATKFAIACHYGDNGDGTVTDYDTGRQWEQKDGTVGGICFIFPGVISHCVNTTYTWADASIFIITELNGTAPDSSTLTGAFAGFSDWRLPTIVELNTIVDQTALGFHSGNPCVDPIFGPTVASFYWSATTVAGDPSNVRIVDFGNGAVSSDLYVRAVRSAL
jgi:hypothetical protein